MSSGSSPSEDKLLEFLVSHTEDVPPTSHNDLATKVENLRLVDSKNDSEAKSYNDEASKTSEAKSKNDETQFSGDAITPPEPQALEPANPPTENHCSGSCEHQRKLSWRECSLKVTENVMNSFQVSYSKLRLVNLFKSFTCE